MPEVYKFLPFSNLVKAPDDAGLQKKYDLAFSLDCGSVKRLGKAQSIWLNAETTVNIDHHVSNERFAKINWIEADATSTGQLVHSLARNLNVNITPEIATLLYTTLLTDTNCFANSNTTPQALSWGAELISSGAKHEAIYRQIFLERPFKSMKVFGAALNNLSLTENGQLIWTVVNKDVMKNHLASGEDTDDVADYMMRTKGVKVGIFFREDENETKVSLRSNINELDVSKIAVSLGGGGHKRAAGINFKKSFLEIKDLILSKVIDEFRSINGKH